VTRSVQRLDLDPPRITIDGGDILRAHTVVLALGVRYRRLDVESCERLTGRGIYYGAARSEASATQGQDIHLIGAGNSAGQAALFFANHARSVTLLVRGDALNKSMSHYLIEQLRGKSNIQVALRSEVQAVHGEEQLKAIDIVDRSTGASRREDCGGVF